MERLFSAVCVFTLLIGCNSTQAGMKLEGPNKEETTLVGIFDVDKRTITASDGDITCSGEAAEIGFEWVPSPVLTYPDLTCSDGRSGTMSLNMSWGARNRSSGIGIGKLSDGTKVKVIIGNLAASLSW